MRLCRLGPGVELAHGAGEEAFETKTFEGGLTSIGDSRSFLDYGGRRISNAPAVEVPSKDPGARILLAEEEIFDVSLATFYVFDKEGEFGPGVKLAAGRGGCGDCRGCGGGCSARSALVACAHGSISGCAGHPGGAAVEVAAAEVAEVAAAAAAAWVSG